MAMSFAVNGGSWGLNNILPLFNNGSLIFYATGGAAQPGSPEVAISTQTALCTFVFSATAFGAPSGTTGNDAATASFVSASITPGASGTVVFARAVLKTMEAWTTAHTYMTQFQIVTSNSNFYINIKPGTAGATAPSATTLVNWDGGVQWAYYAPTTGQNNVLADFDVGTSGQAIIIGSTAITTTVQVTMTSFVLQTAVV